MVKKQVVKVLIVDDDAAGRAMLGLSLRQAGFAVKIAANGAEALSALALEPYDWVVTDCRMYPMDGFDLARKARDLRPGIGIILMSAAYNARDAGDLKIAQFFPKPVPLDKLVAALSSRPAC